MTLLLDIRSGIEAAVLEASNLQIQILSGALTTAEETTANARIAVLVSENEGIYILLVYYFIYR